MENFLENAFFDEILGVFFEKKVAKILSTADF